MKGDLEILPIHTNPAGAKVTVGSEVCYTPCTLELKRKNNYILRIEKSGYLPHEINVSGSSWDGWLWGNIAYVYAMPIAVGVDFYTRKAYDFAPDKVRLDLVKEKK